MSSPRDVPDATPDRGVFGFPRCKRLISSDQISEAFQHRESFAGKYLILRLRKGTDAALRLGVVAGKKTFRRAVDRSRAKRLLRESFRHHQADFAGDCDIVLVAKRAILDVPMQDVARDLIRIGQRAGLISRTGNENDSA